MKYLKDILENKVIKKAPRDKILFYYQDIIR